MDACMRVGVPAEVGCKGHIVDRVEDHAHYVVDALPLATILVVLENV